MASRWTVGLAIALTIGLVGAPLVGAIGTVGADDHTATPGPDAGTDANATANEGLAAELTLSELQRGGERFPGDDPSLRVDDDRPFSVIHWPADQAFSNPGEDDQWRWLRPGGLVDRNAIWLQHYSIDGTDDLTLHIAYYEVGEQRVSVGDGETTTEQVAQNVTVDSIALSFDGGFPDRQAIDLGSPTSRDR